MTVNLFDSTPAHLRPPPDRTSPPRRSAARPKGSGWCSGRVGAGQWTPSFQCGVHPAVSEVVPVLLASVCATWPVGS